MEYSLGVDRAVLYFPDSVDKWVGLTKVQEEVGGEHKDSLYFDGIKYSQSQILEDCKLVVSSFIYPETLDEGRIFNFVYREGRSKGYIYHLLSNLSAIPSTQTFSSEEENNAPSDFEWILISNKNTVHLEADTRFANQDAIDILEDVLFGGEFSSPRFPDQEEILSIFEGNSYFRVVDNGNGTWTAVLPEENLTMVSPTEFAMDWPEVTYIDENTYTLEDW